MKKLELKKKIGMNINWGISQRWEEGKKGK
jgi:hypothetical protein